MKARYSVNSEANLRADPIGAVKQLLHDKCSNFIKYPKMREKAGVSKATVKRLDFLSKWVDVDNMYINEVLVEDAKFVKSLLIGVESILNSNISTSKDIWTDLSASYKNQHEVVVDYVKMLMQGVSKLQATEFATTDDIIEEMYNRVKEGKQLQTNFFIPLVADSIFYPLQTWDKNHIRYELSQARYEECVEPNIDLLKEMPNGAYELYIEGGKEVCVLLKTADTAIRGAIFTENSYIVESFIVELKDIENTIMYCYFWDYMLYQYIGDLVVAPVEAFLAPLDSRVRHYTVSAAQLKGTSESSLKQSLLRMVYAAEQEENTDAPISDVDRAMMYRRIGGILRALTVVGTELNNGGTPEAFKANGTAISDKEKDKLDTSEVYYKMTIN